jgi:parvulin-like peptidyl-prolyl isomerase
MLRRFTENENFLKKIKGVCQPRQKPVKMLCFAQYYSVEVEFMTQKDKKNAVKEKESSSSEISRRFKQNPGLFIGTVVVLVLVIVSFVLVPAIVPESSRAAGDYIFGYYDNVPISWVPGNMFAQYQEQAVQNLQAQGREVNDYRTAAEVWRWAFEGAVVHTAILQMMKRSNYTVPVKTVDREVARLPQFQENGRFSKALYERMSESARLTQWRQVSDELSKKMYYDDYFDLLIPSAEVEFIANMSSVMREFEMVYFKVDDYPDSEYLSYAQGNPSLFDSIHLSMISVSSSEREARKILASINDGTVTFEDAAKTQSQDSYADRGGDMGSRYAYELESDIPDEDARRIILGLGRGELSDLVRIGDNWVIFRIEEELKKADFDDEAVIERVRYYLRSFERGRMEDWAIGQANEFNGEAIESGFETAARWRNMEMFRIGPLPINYGSIDLFTALAISGFNDQDVQNMSRNENFWKIAFSTALQTPSEPFVQGNNVIVLFPRDQTTADEEALERIKTMYSSYWVGFVAQQYIQYYFLTGVNDKMEDNFWDVYFRVFMP